MTNLATLMNTAKNHEGQITIHAIGRWIRSMEVSVMRVLNVNGSFTTAKSIGTIVDISIGSTVNSQKCLVILKTGHNSSGADIYGFYDIQNNNTVRMQCLTAHDASSLYYNIQIIEFN